MRTPSTVFRGVFVCITILGVYLLTKVNIAQSSNEANSQIPDLGAVEHQFVQLTQTEDQSSTNLFHIPFVNNQIIRQFNQGFDKCTPPYIYQMQTWWDSSPYSTINIYLGGISLICPYSKLGSEWFSQVDQMGWSFILTWAGPQAPKGCPDDCKFEHPISLDPAIAIDEGRAEAIAAVDAARSLGFNGQLVIYYDVESYSDVEEGDPSRVATAAFLQGWVEQLHTLGHKAGAYGASCTSYISDWADNETPPDDIWIAYWKFDQYNPNASVWNIPCVPNNLWADQQRLRQYTGGHPETWGDETLTIDSDVIFGEINTLDGIIVPEASLLNSVNHLDQFIQNSTGEPLQVQMLSPDTGWALRGQRLHWTDDGGDSWYEITPVNPDRQTEILGLAFLDTQKGWLVQRFSFPDQFPTLAVLYTSDGGNNWQEVTLPLDSSSEAMQVESATVNLVDATSMWIVLKLHSSSNFSMGRLFATRDGGLTWQERSIPLGEAVKFIDEHRGWVAGGPTGDQLFYTKDGGRTWREQTLTLASPASNGQTTIGLPVFKEDGSVLLPVSINDELVFYSTNDGGDSWSLNQTRQLNLKPEQLDQVSSDLVLDLQNLDGTLPEGLIALDLLTDQYAWALVQDGTCTGYKPQAGETVPTGHRPWQCESYSRLLKTTNGGMSWSEITPTD